MSRRERLVVDRIVLEAARLTASESEGRPTTADPLLRFLHRQGSVATLQPEQQLMLAVLDEAIRTIVRAAGVAWGPGARAVGEARAWMLCDERGGPFCFANLCEALGVNGARLRLILAEWLEPSVVPGP